MLAACWCGRRSQRTERRARSPGSQSGVWARGPERPAQVRRFGGRVTAYEGAVDESDARNRESTQRGDQPTAPVDSPVPASPGGFAPVPPRSHVPFVVPVQIAGYRIVRLIGAGGMGLVYEAEQEALKRRVALKLMQPGAVSGEALARFEAEARALARLKHPGIAQVFDTGVYRPGGDDTSIVPYLSMELVEGSVTLREFAERPGATVEKTLRVIAGVCDALEHAHEAGVVHRDLKPSNILVNPSEDADGSGSIKIIDFGIAKLVGDGSRTITSRGQIVGTPSYMAPEQLSGERVDERTDVYALGVILYEVCTGRLPLEVPRGLDRRGLERAIHEATPAPPRTLDRRLAGDLETIILKCLQKAPMERYQTVRELRADILAFLAGDPIRATRIGAVTAAWRGVGRIGIKRPLTALVYCAGAALLIAMLVVFPLVYFWTGAGLWYANAVGFLAPASGMLGALPDVRVIVIDDETDFESIAEREGLVGVSNSNIRSARLIHAKLLSRLATTDPRAVGIDVTFKAPSEFDAPFIESIGELRKRGVGVVVASPTWGFGADGLPEIAPDVARAAWAGPPTGGFMGADIWSMDIALERDATEVIPGFSTLTFAASRAPDSEVAVSLQSGVAEIRYFKPGTQRRVTVRGADRLRYSGVQKLTEADVERGLLPGDLLVASIVPLPVKALEACTFPIQRTLQMSDAEVRREFSGRIVLIGNAAEAAGDIQVSDTGLRVPGVWMHAAMVQQMLRDEIVDTPNMSVGWTVSSLLAIAGAIAGFCFARSWRALLFTLTLTLIAVCVSVLLLRAGGMYWNPLPAIAAGWLGCGFAMMATHERRRVVAVR